MILFFIVVNRQGQTKLSKYYSQNLPTQDQKNLSLKAKLLENVCLNLEHNILLFFQFSKWDCTIAFKKFANLYFILGIDKEENELASLELIQHIVEVIDSQFDKISEIDFMFNLEKIHFIVDEIISVGDVSHHTKDRLKVIQDFFN